MLLALCCGLTACGDDDDDLAGPDVWGTSYTMEVTFTADFLKVADITAHVAKPDGTFYSEPVTTASTKWKLTGNKIPDKAGVLFTFVPKQNIAEGVYELGVNSNVTVQSYKNNELYQTKAKANSYKFSVNSDKVADYLQRGREAVTAGIDAEGNVVSVNSEDIDFGLNAEGIYEWLADILAGNSDGK